jgi:hypothetical protein
LLGREGSAVGAAWAVGFRAAGLGRGRSVRRFWNRIGGGGRGARERRGCGGAVVAVPPAPPAAAGPGAKGDSLRRL